MLMGEVVRKFQHIITGAAMYKVDFGGVLGTQAVLKDKCHPITKGDMFATAIGASDGNMEVPIPTSQSTFTLELPSYLELGEDDNNEGVLDPDWKADFADWQGNINSGNSDWILSDEGSDREVVEDSNIDAQDLDFDSLGFEHRYALEH